MTEQRKGRKLSVYVNETDRIHGRPVYEAVMEALSKRKIAGISVFRGIEGYGGDRVFHSAKVLELSTSLPVKIEAVDETEKIQAVIDEVAAVVEKGLITVSETSLVSRSG